MNSIHDELKEIKQMAIYVGRQQGKTRVLLDYMRNVDKLGVRFRHTTIDDVCGKCEYNVNNYCSNNNCEVLKLFTEESYA